MKLNKFLFILKKNMRKRKIKKVEASEADISFVVQTICDLNKAERQAEKTLVFDACGVAGGEFLFFDERLPRKKSKIK